MRSQDMHVYGVAVFAVLQANAAHEAAPQQHKNILTAGHYTALNSY